MPRMCIPLRTPVRLMRLWLRTGKADERGAELFEFALVSIPLLMLLLGIIWLGLAYSTYGTITRAAREGARYAAAYSCALCPTATQTYCGNTTTVGATNSAPSGADVQTVVNCMLTAGSLSPSNVTNYSFQQNVLLNGTNPPPACPNPVSVTQECGVVVSFTYPVPLPIPFTSLAAGTVTINTQVQMRQEN